MRKCYIVRRTDWEAAIWRRTGRTGSHPVPYGISTFTLKNRWAEFVGFL